MATALAIYGALSLAATLTRFIVWLDTPPRKERTPNWPAEERTTAETAAGAAVRRGSPPGADDGRRNERSDET